MNLDNLTEQIDHESLEKDWLSANISKYISAFSIVTGVFLLTRDHELANMYGTGFLAPGILFGLGSLGLYMRASNPLNYIKNRETED